MRKTNSIGISQIRVNAILFIAVLFAFCESVFAEKMSYTLQEAIYLFEMKGEVHSAISRLEKVATEGDAEDREKANFFLGKIQELANNSSSANFYYTQSLSETKNTSKAYWLAERSAATSRSYETVLKNVINLNSPIKRIFRGNSTYIQLRNGTIKKFVGDTLFNIHPQLPSNTEILHIDDQNIWFQNEERDSLYLRAQNNPNIFKSFPVEATTSLFAKGEYALVQGVRTLTLLNQKGIKAVVKEKYNGCEIENFYATTGHYILNCPDNALHFISEEDANESYSISQFESIQKVLVDRNNLFLLAGSTLYCYQPKLSASPRWKVSFSNAENILVFEDNVAVLEASGRVQLVKKTDGTIKSVLRSDASSMQELARGTLGLFTNEGALTVVDTLLRPLWNFNFSRNTIYAPIRTESSIYLIFDESYLQKITPHYYGKRPLLSGILSAQAAIMTERGDWDNLPPLLDSIFKQEPGNAEAWLFKALYLENTNGPDKDRQKAWSEAVRHSVSNPHATPIILGRYGKAIGAKFVSLLNVSPKTKYPQLFGSKKNLYTIDPSAERLLCLNAETGDIRWSKNLVKMDNSPVMAHDDNTLALVSGFSLHIYELTKDSKPSSVQLPGKAFSIQISDNAIYVSTWNGFLVKILKSESRLAWSRKIFSVPTLFSVRNGELHLVNLEGDIVHLWEASGQIKSNGDKLQNNIALIAQADSMQAIAASNNKLYLYNTDLPDKEPIQILLESAITSLQPVSFQGKDHFIVGLSDQSILFYANNGTPLWKYQGQGTIFNTPYAHDGIAWLDQGKEVVGISLKDGKIIKKFSTPGGAGTPFVINKNLYSVSAKRLLYGFSL